MERDSKRGIHTVKNAELPTSRISRAIEIKTYKHGQKIASEFEI